MPLVKMIAADIAHIVVVVRDAIGSGQARARQQLDRRPLGNDEIGTRDLVDPLTLLAA